MGDEHESDISVTPWGNHGYIHIDKCMGRRRGQRGVKLNIELFQLY